MTLGVLGLAGLLLVPLLVGHALVRWILRGSRADALALAGLAYPAGTLALGLVLVLWLALALPLRPGPPLLALGLLAALSWRLSRSSAAETERVRLEPRDWPLLAALALALALTLARALAAARFPVLTGDESGIYACKARILFDVGALGEPLAARARQQAAPHFDYPALTPLLHLWSFVLGGRILLIEDRFLVQLAGAALFVLLASGLRRRLRPLPAALLLFLTASAPEMAANAATGAADLMTALGLLAALEFAERWRADRRSGDLRAFALALAFLVWCKNEGLMYALVIVAVLLARLGRRPALREAAWLLLPGLIVIGTWGYNTRHGFANDVINREAGASLAAHAGERWSTVLAYLGRVLFAEPQPFHFLFALLVLALIAHPRGLADGELGLSAGVVGLCLLGHYVIYLLTPNELAWHLDTSAERVVFHALPAAVLALARAAALHPWLGPRLSSSPAAGRLQQPELA